MFHFGRVFNEKIYFIPSRIGVRLIFRSDMKTNHSYQIMFLSSTEPFLGKKSRSNSYFFINIDQIFTRKSIIIS